VIAWKWKGDRFFDRFVDKDGKILPTLHSGQHIKMIVALKSADKFLHNVDLRLDVFDKMGQQWFLLSNTISDGTFLQCPGEAVLECDIPSFPLGEGHYILNASLNINNQKSDFIQQLHRSKFFRVIFTGQADYRPHQMVCL
jgi:hypothetical protein